MPPREQFEFQEGKEMAMTRDFFITANVQSIGLDCFPDNDDVRWELVRTWHEGDYSMVEVQPQPATVGYDSFRFVLRFAASGEGAVVGCYCLDRQKWELLFSSPDENICWQNMFNAQLQS